MRNYFAAATMCAATLALTPTPASAADLDLRHVGADAQFVVHVDFEAMRESEAGRAMINIISEVAEDGLDELQDELGIDPFDNFDSATVYGASDDEDDLVVIVRGNGRLADAIDEAREKIEDIDDREERGVEFEAWDMGGETLYVFESSRRDSTILVIGFDDDRLVDGVRVLAGEDDGLDDDALEAFGEPDRDAWVFVSVSGAMGPGDMGPASEMLKLTDRVVVQIGGDEQLEVSLDLTTESHDDAKNLMDLLNGAMALARMAISQEDFGTDEEREAVRKLADGLRVDGEGRRVRIHTSLDPDWVGKMLEDQLD
jgi:hypothetical protein